jgi:hypothetical protein
MCEIAQEVTAEILRLLSPYPPVSSTHLTRIEKYMCGSKKRYSSKTNAKECVKNSLRRGMPPQNVYECPFCHWWHTSTHKGQCESYDGLRKRVLATLAI